MTTNQIAYQKNLISNAQLAEESRANRERERENIRSNKMKERQQRAELVEQRRHNINADTAAGMNAFANMLKGVGSLL